MNLKMKASNCAILFALVVFLSELPKTLQLECYICQNQEDNKGKCAETVKTCDLSQDQCLTEVRWGSIPNWALTSKKQYYISKRCATKLECRDAIADTQQKCDRIWFNDWNCTSCCSGDKCNYYVTLASGTLQPSSLILILLSQLVAAILYRSNNLYLTKSTHHNQVYFTQ